MTRMTAMLAVALLVAVGFAQDPGCGACRTCGNEETVIPEGFEAKVEKLDSMTVAVIAATGPYQASGMKIGELFAWLGTAGVKMTGAPFGVYYDDPESVPPESTRYEIGAPVSPDAESDPDAGVEVRPWGGILLAKTMHLGGYDKLTATYCALQAWVDANEYFIAGPAIEFYLNSPMEVPAESLKTEVCFQVLPKTE